MLVRAGWAKGESMLGEGRVHRQQLHGDLHGGKSRHRGALLYRMRIHTLSLVWNSGQCCVLNMIWKWPCAAAAAAGVPQHIKASMHPTNY
jgi:hypothetical protein